MTPDEIRKIIRMALALIVGWIAGGLAAWHFHFSLLSVMGIGFGSTLFVMVALGDYL